MSSAATAWIKKPFVNVHEAKTHLSALLEMIEKGGQDIVIARAGRPIARLTSYVPPPPSSRKLGTMRFKIRLDDDAFAPATDDQVTKLFEGGDDPSRK